MYPFQIPSLMSTIQKFTERQDELEKQLKVNVEASAKHAAEVQRLEKLYQQEKLNVDRLERELDEAKQGSFSLQSDGRPSFGDGKVAQALRKENEDLLRQLNEMQKVHVFKTKQLQDRIDELKHMEVECNNLREEISTMRYCLFLILKTRRKIIKCLLFQSRFQFPGERNANRGTEGENHPLRSGVRRHEQSPPVITATE